MYSPSIHINIVTESELASPRYQEWGALSFGFANSTCGIVPIKLNGVVYGTEVTKQRIGSCYVVIVLIPLLLLRAGDLAMAMCFLTTPIASSSFSSLAGAYLYFPCPMRVYICACVVWSFLREVRPYQFNMCVCEGGNEVKWRPDRRIRSQERQYTPHHAPPPSRSGL